MTKTNGNKQMVDYEKISNNLIKNAVGNSSGRFLDENRLFATIEQLCESSQGGLEFLDAVSKIDDSQTKNKLIGILKWACDKANSDANAKNWIIETIKLIMLTSVGFIVALFLGFIQSIPTFTVPNSVFMVVMFIVGLLSVLVLRHYVNDRNANLNISIRSNSLIEMVKME